MPRLNGIPVSPRARRLIRTQKISPIGLRGTGPNGRIVQTDLRAAALSGTSASAMRLAIARATTASFAVPHFFLRVEIDASELMAFRSAHLENVQRSHGIKITVTDLFLKAVGCALTQHPAANSVWHEDSLVSRADASVGLVVSVPDGLLIPVLRRVNALDLATLAAERRTVVEAARAWRLSAEETRGATASISNLGNSRVDEFSAILAPGQTTMLTIGRIAARPFVHKGQLSVRATVRLTLTVDHRVLDGEGAATYLGSICEGLENPGALFSGSSVSH